jgi:hypothetical protein
LPLEGYEEICMIENRFVTISGLSKLNYKKSVTHFIRILIEREEVTVHLDPSLQFFCNSVSA